MRVKIRDRFINVYDLEHQLILGTFTNYYLQRHNYDIIKNLDSSKTIEDVLKIKTQILKIDSITGITPYSFYSKMQELYRKGNPEYLKKSYIEIRANKERVLNLEGDSVLILNSEKDILFLPRPKPHCYTGYWSVRMHIEKRIDNST
jgi:hypothetical protein